MCAAMECREYREYMSTGRGLGALGVVCCTHMCVWDPPRTGAPPRAHPAAPKFHKKDTTGVHDEVRTHAADPTHTVHAPTVHH